MDLRNREGKRVDPMPWVVTVSLGFMLLFSVGPIYLHEYGLDPLPSVIALIAIFLGVVVGSYWRLVHTVRPDLRGEIPPDVRLERLFYAILAGILVLIAVSLPIATRYR
jgi:hypothetical protein